MGIDCCKIKSNKEELENEIRKDLKISDFETKVTKIEESERSYIFKNSFRSANEQIFFEIKDSPYEDYSKSVFSRLNEIRCHPLYFHSNSRKYKLTNLIEKVIKNQLTYTKLTWSILKTKVIYRIMHNEKMTINNKLSQLEKLFNKENKTYIYYSIGFIDSIDNCLWNLFSNFTNESYFILTENYTLCSIYTENLKNEHFVNLKNLKDYTKNFTNYNNTNYEPLITFFFFFQKIHSI